MTYSVIYGVHIGALMFLMLIIIQILTGLKSAKRELFVLFLFCVFLYVLGSLLEIRATTVDGAIPGMWLLALGGTLVPPTFLMFLQRYCEKQLPKLLNYVIFANAFFIIALVWTAEWHSLFYTSIFVLPEDAGLSVRSWDLTPGVLYFFVMVFYPAVCVILSLKVLIEDLSTSKGMRKKRLMILGICAVSPGITQLLDYIGMYIFGIYNAIVVLPLICIIGYFGLFKYDLFENEEAIRAQNHLKQMIAQISHDIKTPLTILSISIQKLFSTSSGSEAYSRNVRLAYNKSLDLQHLIQNMIEATRIEANQNSYDSERISLDFILAKIQERYCDYLESCGLTLDIDDFSKGVVQISADLARIWSVFDNIIYNAVRHTKSGGIKIEVEEIDEVWLCISIIDTGCGILPENLANIHERLYKIKNRQEIQSGGSGLGLFIIKDIMEGIGGQITIKSKVGIGTTVELKFVKEKQVV